MGEERSWNIRCQAIDTLRDYSDVAHQRFRSLAPLLADSFAHIFVREISETHSISFVLPWQMSIFLQQVYPPSSDSLLGGRGCRRSDPNTESPTPYLRLHHN
jgi:hypothetical protein